MTLPQIRRVAGDHYATILLRQINGNQVVGLRPCPFCVRPMQVFDSAEVQLDACKTCGVVWFDPSEITSVPEGAIETSDEARLRGIETQATWQLEQLKERGITDSGPDETWKTIPALFGFPVESGTDPLARRPWMTWSLALLITLVSVLAFRHLGQVTERFGFIPAEALRYGGATSLTSFFLHGGLWHLIGNLYFLLLFGDNVEDYVGRGRYLLLIFGSTLAGDALHWLAQTSSTVPSIGASGGISGIIVFYALQFPRARLGFLFGVYFRFRWVQMAAWVALVLWMLLQTVTVMLQLGGFSNVAATAHLGGAAAGFLFWLRWRRL